MGNRSQRGARLLPTGALRAPRVHRVHSTGPCRLRSHDLGRPVRTERTTEQAFRGWGRALLSECPCTAHRVTRPTQHTPHTAHTAHTARRGGQGGVAGKGRDGQDAVQGRNGRLRAAVGCGGDAEEGQGKKGEGTQGPERAQACDHGILLLPGRHEGNGARPNDHHEMTHQATR